LKIKSADVNSNGTFKAQFDLLMVSADVVLVQEQGRLHYATRTRGETVNSAMRWTKSLGVQC
jgi:hypothetical protein